VDALPLSTAATVVLPVVSADVLPPVRDRVLPGGDVSWLRSA